MRTWCLNNGCAGTCDSDGFSKCVLKAQNAAIGFQKGDLNFMARLLKERRQLEQKLFRNARELLALFVDESREAEARAERRRVHDQIPKFVTFGKGKRQPLGNRLNGLQKIRARHERALQNSEIAKNCAKLRMALKGETEIGKARRRKTQEEQSPNFGRSGIPTQKELREMIKRRKRK